MTLGASVVQNVIFFIAQIDVCNIHVVHTFPKAWE